MRGAGQTSCQFHRGEAVSPNDRDVSTITDDGMQLFRRVPVMQVYDTSRYMHCIRLKVRGSKEIKDNPNNSVNHIG